MSVVIFISLIDFILSALAWFYYSHAFPFIKSAGFILLYLFLMVNTVGSRVLPDWLPAFVLKLSAWLSGYWVAFLYYSLLLMVGHGVLYAALRLLSVRLPFTQFAAVGAAFLVVFIAWGSWRAFSPVVRNETVVTQKLAQGEHYKIVLVSDIHLGRELGYKYSSGLVDLVNAQRPDMVLIAGDIMDERLKYIAEENSIEPLSRLKAPLGVYAAFGNHDYLDGPKELRALLEANKVHVLTDESTVVDGKLKITGLHDYRVSTSVVPLQQLSEGNDKYYSVLIDHQPRRIDAAEAAGYDMYVAGHTHTGQLFPNRLVTKKMYKLDYGLKQFGSLTAIVSNGYGFWGPPVRTELKPEIVVIDLQGK